MNGVYYGGGRRYMFKKLFKPGIYTLLSVFVLLTGCGVNGSDNEQAAAVEGSTRLLWLIQYSEMSVMCHALKRP